LKIFIAVIHFYPHLWWTVFYSADTRIHHCYHRCPWYQCGRGWGFQSHHRISDVSDRTFSLSL